MPNAGRITRPVIVEDNVSKPQPWNNMPEQIVYATTFAKYFDAENAGSQLLDDRAAIEAHALALVAVEAFRRNFDSGG